MKKTIMMSLQNGSLSFRWYLHLYYKSYPEEREKVMAQIKKKEKESQREKSN